MSNKTCVVCGEPLSGKQTRTCSIRCRNVVAGRVGTPRLAKIDREWLKAQYLLPPDGLGRSTADIGHELGFTNVRIQQVIAEYGFRQDTKMRIRYFRKLQPSRKIPCPDIPKLVSLYSTPPEGRGMNQGQVGKEMGVSRPTVERWLRELGIHQEFGERHSQRMSNEGNPAYRGGNSQSYVVRWLAKVSPKVCAWCGNNKTVQVHHINHDRSNNTRDNLMWLCRNCNTLEGHLNALIERGFATCDLDQAITENKLVIVFRR